MAIGKRSMPDVVLIGLIILSISMTALAVSNLVTSSSYFGVNVSQPNLSPTTNPDSSQDSQENDSVESSQREGGVYGGGTQNGPVSSLAPAYNQGPLDTFYSPIHESSQYIMPITWGAVAGALIWRGKVRSAWCKQGYDYETFRLMSRMKGSPVRVKLLTLVIVPKNRLQLANELDLDWKTIDNHMETLTRNGLVEERTIVGTTRYYVLSEHGRRVLLLLSEGEKESGMPEEPFIAGLKN